jgi:uncharacterized delta-60 repeat protein
MKRYVHLNGALCCCLFVFTTNFSSFAQPGSLDPLFGDDGSGKRFILDFDLFYVANKTLEMPDGKILISGAGATDNGNKYTPFVARLFPNGDTDVDFADSGFIRNDVPLTFDLNCWSLIRQPDGKIVQSGRYYNLQTGRYDLYIIRYLENGLLDETFGDNNNGLVLKTIPGFSIRYTQDLILQPDGKIVAPGSKVDSTNGTSTLMYFRYLSDGKPDPEFGTNGIAEIDLGYFKQNTGYLELLPDGKILGAGSIISEQNGVINLIVRLNPDGTLDDTFGDGGNTIFSYGSVNQSVTDLKVTADGRILVAGYVENLNGNTGFDFAIARFNSDGSLDESFGDDGYRFLDGGTDSDAGNSIDIQPDGKILFAGVKNSGYPSILIFRLNEDGTTDTDFGVNGAVVIDDEVYIPRIAIQSNGTALISGQGDTHVPTNKPGFYIARMLLDLNIGTLESNTINSGLMFYPNPINDQALLGYELSKDQYVEATIYSSDGTLVGICLPKSRQTAGKHKEQLHITPNLPAGNYLMKITADDVVKTVKIIKI